jgi:hypothetical protein
LPCTKSRTLKIPSRLSALGSTIQLRLVSVTTPPKVSHLYLSIIAVH